MNAPPLRPLAERMKNGRIAVYIAAGYQHLTHSEAVELLEQLSAALADPGDGPPIQQTEPKAVEPHAV